ncbi:hypothetical protein BS47DRAFT_1368991 [Hydnum rufescens UP504]|uniref:Uncharacterized protein n=1 Tax=Hydnum rufescens UP504 TaxID=1448309 RepID=A0A9P6AFW0_9AGAM|nr:hypothetical protein BS47DRAFT_1368991 [Hydnum rufescens UP504]
MCSPKPMGQQAEYGTTHPLRQVPPCMKPHLTRMWVKYSTTHLLEWVCGTIYCYSRPPLCQNLPNKSMDEAPHVVPMCAAPENSEGPALHDITTPMAAGVVISVITFKWAVTSNEMAMQRIWLVLWHARAERTCIGNAGLQQENQELVQSKALHSFQQDFWQGEKYATQD